ncbi:MAG TPA: efflux RND transporter periplasmic adaptor subunit [Steroidobacteraceae bacterium]|nr:efflux RND transporter periplasmic adaptor subunit [Steroidobacteraceae bacterium]
MNDTHLDSNSATTPALAPPDQRAARGPGRRLGWGAAIAVLLALLAWGAHAWRLGGRAPQQKVLTVAVAPVTRSDLYQEFAIPAEFHAYAEVDLHAKVAGYVAQMRVDIGDRVKAGELLAVLEVPELTDALNHDIATEQRSTAEYRDAHLAYTRLVAVNHEHPNLIAQQDLDTAEARDATAAGVLAAAKADVARDQTLVSYARITAPFDGVITRRYADPGALIQAGTASQTQSMPVVRVSQNYRLRLDFPVSVDYVQGIHLNEPLTVRVQSLGGRTFKGTIARFTHAVDASTRTMTVEMEVDNHDLSIVPGMYATVILRADHRANVLSIPIEALPAGAHAVYTVDRSSHLAERSVQLGIETPTRYEVLAGLSEGDEVVIGNTSQLRSGLKVAARQIATAEPRAEERPTPVAAAAPPAAGISP